MPPGDLILLVILIILIYLSSFFSAAETALTAVNRHKLRSAADEGNLRAARVLKVLEDQPRMLTAILIGNNIVNLTASALTTILCAKMGGRWNIVVGTIVLTIIILLFGEITPKTTAALNAEKIALRYIPVIEFLILILTPVSFLINALSRLILRMRHIRIDEDAGSITEDELRTIVQVSHEEGVIASDEKEMINNVFDLGDSQARDVMVPRVDVVTTDINASFHEILDLFNRNPFTRFPVCDGSPDKIVGILNIKDLVTYRADTAFSVRDFMREPFFTHEFKSTTELLREMKRARVSISIVLDEYGVPVGIITIEDIIEEIVGDIRDEFEMEEPEEIKKISANEYIIEGSYRLDDLNHALRIDLKSEDYDSIGGFLVEHLDHFPEEGESCTTEDGYRLIAEKVDHNRIEAVHLYLPEKASEPTDPEGSHESAEPDQKKPGKDSETRDEKNI